ncbi:3-carboxy-cis,cis-muconate cycloisomerase [Aureimonas sp. ME7]|uniref:3-carboxy-cis,cis-muconate cycloisomerase n=1 Tax=Aureimonas sp. ME7 TaxID=2744252 RepID=UPI0015F70B98|nr:3-carboxy-cis,cis-muconate cycloisomerase [Aureimonas sp. ME7]
MTREPLLGALTGDTSIAALFRPDAEVDALRRFEIALAEAEAAAGLIDPSAAEAIGRALADMAFDFDRLASGLRRDGVVVPELVRQLRQVVGEPFGGLVHLGATSQDAIDTGLMLRLRTVFDILGGRLSTLIDRLDRLDAEQGTRTLMAQTRMQAALPFTVAAKLRTWTTPLRNHARRLASLREGLAVQLAGPIGDGSSFWGEAAAVRAELARRLDLADAAPWHSDRTAIMDVAQGLVLLTGTLGKIGQDVALMAQNEIAAIKLAGGGASSAMAHKQNPVGAEVLVAIARLNANLMGALQQSMIHENERSGSAWTLEWSVVPQIAEATGAALGHALELLDGATLGRSR